VSTTETLTSRHRGRAHRYRDAAEILKVSERQVIRLVRRGVLRADKLSERVVRIFDDSIDAYLERVRGEHA
jgi:excisionase family DNA binding protein